MEKKVKKDINEILNKKILSLLACLDVGVVFFIGDFYYFHNVGIFS